MKNVMWLKLTVAAFVFGMATGYCGALWQICAQKAHARQEMSIESPYQAVPSSGLSFFESLL